MKANAFAVVLLFVTACFQTATASPYPPGNPLGYNPGAARDKMTSINPAAIVREGVDKLTAFIQSGQAQNREHALAFMETEIEPYFDFEYMTQWAAGSAWRRMSPQQRATMENQLKTSFMNTLASKLITYSDQPIRYFTPRGQESNDVRVNMWIMQPNGIPTRLEFRFYRNNRNQWKIFDVKAEGNSAVVYYRNKFRDLMRPERSYRAAYY